MQDPQMDNQALDQLAELAGLSLGEKEREKLRDDLSEMLKFVGHLQEVDTSGVAPMLHPLEEAGKLATDESGQALDREAILKQAAHRNGAYFSVPQVLNKRKKS